MCGGLPAVRTGTWQCAVTWVLGMQEQCILTGVCRNSLGRHRAARWVICDWDTGCYCDTCDTLPLDPAPGLGHQDSTQEFEAGVRRACLFRRRRVTRAAQQQQPSRVSDQPTHQSQIHSAGRQVRRQAAKHALALRLLGSVRELTGPAHRYTQVSMPTFKPIIITHLATTTARASPQHIHTQCFPCALYNTHIHTRASSSTHVPQWSRPGRRRLRRQQQVPRPPPRPAAPPARRLLTPPPF